MTITLNLTPEMEAGLLAQAQASGMTLEEYLLSLVEEVALPAAQEADRPTREEAVRRMLEFGDKHHLSLGEPVAREVLRERAGETTPTGSKSEPFWKSFTRQVHALPDEVFEHLPEDGASEHDHYLYGAPKRNG